MMSFIKYYKSKPAKAFLALLLFFGAAKFCRAQTDGFRVIKTQRDMAFNPAWESPLLSLGQEQEMEKLLSQKFFFLGSGVQSYAFLSEDGKTVLKLFKHYHMWPNTQLLRKIHLPFAESFLEKTVQEREKRMAYIFNSCKISYSDCQEETGVFLLMLNGSKGKKVISVFDKIGIEHKIDLEKTPFLLQRKASPLLPFFRDCMKKGKENEAKKAIHAVFVLEKSRLEKGILNTDRKFCRNIGFYEGKAMHIDIGSFDRSSPLESKERIAFEAKRELGEFKTFLANEYPGLLQDFEHNYHTFFCHD